MSGIWNTQRPLGLFVSIWNIRKEVHTHIVPESSPALEWSVTLVRQQGHQPPRERPEIGEWSIMGCHVFHIYSIGSITTRTKDGGNIQVAFNAMLCYAFMGVCAAIGNPNSSSWTSFLSSLVAVGSASDAFGKSTLVALSSCK